MFRFKIRDLLWLTVVVALGLAWIAKDREVRQVRHDAELLAEETLYVPPQGDAQTRVIYDLQVKYRALDPKVDPPPDH